MRIARIIAIALMVVTIPIMAFAATPITFSEGSRYVGSASGHYIKGKVGIANGQYVVLYNSKGKLIKYANVDSSGKFSFATPKLSMGDNYFYVKSLKGGYAGASDTYKINLKYISLKVPLVTYAFSTTGRTTSIGAKGVGIKYSSSNPSVVSVNGSGLMTSKKPGSATISVKADGVTKKVWVTVPKMKSRNDALKPWWDAQKAQRSASWNSYYSWTRPTVGNSKKRGTCITFPSVSAQRAGLIKPYHHLGASDGAYGSLKGDVQRAMASVSKKYWQMWWKPGGTTKQLVNSGKILPGDVLGSGLHSYIYAGKRGNTLLYNHSGKVCGISSGPGSNRATWGAPSSFNDNQTVWMIARIKDFNVYTQGINCQITPSNKYMAGDTITVYFKPIKGKKITAIYVDGKKISTNRSSYKFKKIGSPHGITVVCN